MKQKANRMPKCIYLPTAFVCFNCNKYVKNHAIQHYIKPSLAHPRKAQSSAATEVGCDVISAADIVASSTVYPFLFFALYLLHFSWRGRVFHSIVHFVHHYSTRMFALYRQCRIAAVSYFPVVFFRFSWCAVRAVIMSLTWLSLALVGRVS